MKREQMRQEDAQIKCPVRGFHWDPRRRTWFKREPASPYSPDYKNE